ncbi:chemotaxis protein CheA [Mesorhizobium sp. RP14(2022)]|uniref:Chemotaxis protein CheA n=1 Tax=Mesorhizobium liriopis TaxID=2953882 RepID=A0ABT1C8B5_9HYPH|nr:chemotaxis protein CheA [Mesorhizobium liriopis]MCO6051054.1 chemotaxis protein CheA [Mesorhizobium liriopis]
MSQPDPVAIFRQEATELLETLEANLLQLDETPDDKAVVDSAFRALHTLKGSGAMFGFTAAASFVHEFETAFDRVRKGEKTATPALIRVALQARDHIMILIEDPDSAGSEGETLLAALRQAVEGEAKAEAAPALVIEAPVAEAWPSGWKISFSLPADALAMGSNPLLLIDELAELGPCDVRARIAGVASLDTLDPTRSALGWEVVLRGDVSRAQIDDVFMFLSDDMELTVEALGEPASEAPAPAAPPIAEAAPSLAAAPAVAPAPAPAQAAKPKTKPKTESPAPQKAASSDKSNSSLRVPAERLDALMDRVGELVIAQARLNQLAAQANDPNLKSVAEDIERLSSSLRDTTMGIRMVPIGTLFGRFRRLVHDLSHDLGKEIEFVTAGEDTELDKTVIEHLADPLVHLIRNSVDHGLESADKRLAAGKPSGGTVRLSATYAGAEVAISVSDDGAGLDPARIRQKAEEAGLITSEAKLSEQELFQLIFQPGFSTAKEITALSGRGVGMDVVKRTIDGLRGSIDLSSQMGLGTTATLRLPLTLAIIDGLLVRIGDGRYTIPLAAVEECVELPLDADGEGRGRAFLNIRGSLVPFIRLREVFNLSTPPGQYQKVVIISSGDMRVGLVVDQILGNNQTVIKQLSKLHAGVRHFSGATILGDGTVALILDPMQLATFGQHGDGTHAEQTFGRAA